MGSAEFGHSVGPHAAALGPEEEEVSHHSHGRQDQQRRQQQLQPVGGLWRRVVIGGDDALFTLGRDQVIQVVVEEIEIVQAVAKGFDAILPLLPQGHGQIVPAVDGEALHLLLDEELPHVEIVQLGGAGLRLPQPAEADYDNQRKKYEAEISRPVLLSHASPSFGDKIALGLRRWRSVFLRIRPVSGDEPMVPGQGLDASVIGGLPLRGEEAAGHALAVVPVVGNTFAAFTVPGTAVSAGAGPGVFTMVHRAVSSFLSRCIPPALVRLCRGRCGTPGSSPGRSPPQTRRAPQSRRGRR